MATTRRSGKPKEKRLAKNFHRTFIPERQYLGALLKYAAGDGLYDKDAIAEATGIPTGKSSGKALPTADYCRGMGLVSLRKGDNNAQKLALTDFGRAVYLEDKFFREELTQWLAHLFLCGRNGAEVWHQLFWNGYTVFGMRFSRTSCLNWLGALLDGKDVETAVSPTFRMYANDASFPTCGAVVVDGDNAERKAAPITPEYACGYAAWLTQAMEAAKRGTSQVSVDELEEMCGFRSVTGWTLPQSQEALALLEMKNLAAIDRHMTPWLVTFHHTSAALWPRLYEDFI